MTEFSDKILAEELAKIKKRDEKLTEMIHSQTFNGTQPLSHKINSAWSPLGEIWRLTI